MIPNEILVEEAALKTILLAAEMLGSYEYRCIAISREHNLEGGNIVVDQFHIEEDQVASRAHVKTGEVNFGQLQQYQRQGALLLGSAHSHGDMSVFYSGTDREQFEIDMGAFNGFSDHEYLEFEPRMVRSDDQGETLILRAFNTTNLDIVAPTAKADHVQGLQGSLSARLLLRTTKTIVGITVNNRGDVFGIKRVRDSRYLCRPGDAVKPDPDWQDVRTSGNTVEYSLECDVVSLDRGTTRVVDADRLLEELRQKIRFDGEPPPAFRKKVRVSLPPPDRRSRNAAEALIDYSLAGLRRSRLVASAIGWAFAVEGQGFADALLAEMIDDPRVEDIDPISFAQTLAAQHNDESLDQLVHALNPGLLSRIIGRDDAARVIEEWVDEIVGPPQPARVVNSIPDDENQTSIIKCDPIRNFHSIHRHYMKMSTDSNYLSLHSTLCRIQDFREEYERRFEPREHHLRLLDRLIDRIEYDLGRRRTREQMLLLKAWRSLTATESDGDDQVPADQLWSIRDGMILLGMNREAREVNQRLEVGRVEFHSQETMCRSTR